MFLIPISVEKSELLNTIEMLRNEMIQIGKKEGLSSEKTIEISQRLDAFISKYQAVHFS